MLTPLQSLAGSVPLQGAPVQQPPRCGWRGHLLASPGVGVLEFHPPGHQQVVEQGVVPGGESRS